MRKKAIIFILCLWCLNTANAQYVGLSVGYTIPSGMFGNSSFADKESGFATAGYTFGLNCNFLLNDYFGISADISRSVANFNTSGFSSELNRTYPGLQYEVDVPNGYIIHTSLLGLQGRLVYKKMAYGIRLMAGFANMSAPEKRISQQFSGNTLTVITESRTDMAPAFSWGLSGSYQLNQYLYLIGNVDQVVSDLEFDFDYRSNTQDKNRLPLDMFKATLGLGIHIQDN